MPSVPKGTHGIRTAFFGLSAVTCQAGSQPIRPFAPGYVGGFKAAMTYAGRSLRETMQAHTRTK